MELGTLKRLRIIIPGVMIVLIFGPLGQRDLTYDWVWVDRLIQSVAVLVCGALYYILNFRRYFIQGPLAQIHRNIHRRLLDACLNDRQIGAARDRLVQGRALLEVFYWFVDRDASLTEKAKNVRMNGLIWTSAADLGAVSAMGVLIYWMAELFWEPRPHYLILAALLALIHFGAVHWMLPSLTKRHIRLSDEQLEYIRINYREELCERLRVAAREA